MRWPENSAAPQYLTEIVFGHTYFSFNKYIAYSAI